MEILKPCAVQINCFNKTLTLPNITPAVYAAVAVSDLLFAPFKHAKRMVCERGYAKENLKRSACLTGAFLFTACCGGKNLAVSMPEAAVICVGIGLLAGQFLGVTANIGFPEDRAKRTNNLVNRFVNSLSPTCSA